jgi:hypothetical protein
MSILLFFVAVFLIFLVAVWANERRPNKLPKFA